MTPKPDEPMTSIPSEMLAGRLEEFERKFGGPSYFTPAEAALGRRHLRQAASLLRRQAEALKEAEGALEPFGEACAHLHPLHPDDGETLDGFKVGHFRRAASTLSKIQKLMGGEDGDLR